jgi:hypothetical protein
MSFHDNIGWDLWPPRLYQHKLIGHIQYKCMIYNSCSFMLNVRQMVSNYISANGSANWKWIKKSMVPLDLPPTAVRMNLRGPLSPPDGTSWSWSMVPSENTPRELSNMVMSVCFDNLECLGQFLCLALCDRNRHQFDLKRYCQKG